MVAQTATLRGFENTAKRLLQPEKAMAASTEIQSQAQRTTHGGRQAVEAVNVPLA